MYVYLIYILNIFIVALPWALFEIIIEKDSGWGSRWPKNKWYAKKFAPENSLVRFIVQLLKIESPLNYHALVFAAVLPVIFLFEYFFWTRNVMLLLASFIGVIVFEDFFWFLFNWNFDSLKQLLKGPGGSIWWHKGWTKIRRNYYLPSSYFSVLSLSIILLLLARL